MKNLLLFLFPLALLPSSAWSFAGVGNSLLSQSSNSLLRWRRRALSSSSGVLVLSAAKRDRKKKLPGGGSGGGEGFGKGGGGRSSSSSAPPAAIREDGRTPTMPSTSRPLQSIDISSSSSSAAVDVDLEGLSPEERSRAILRSKFGLKSYEEQQADLGDYRLVVDAEEKRKRRDGLRNVEAMWPEDRDLLAVLPASVVRGVDAFLKLGLGVSTVLFVVAGMFITVEAGSKATGRPMPDGLEAWIVDVVEPNFTPGLGVLLAFSVSLGLFSVSLGGSAASTYREDR
ncbi:hypothetical protein ACHAW5_008769 [Stephanodiscus triporus]|uniref:Uncharacterized protein n=1 Tax=Stephanodiscus triporus TaxID=2934178 RepID=A0ABD3PAD0_9STRA